MGAQQKDETKYRSSVALVLKNGVQVSTKTIHYAPFIWQDYLSDAAIFMLEVGDPQKNVMRVRKDEISLISVMDYVDENSEAEHAKRSGLIVPQRGMGGIQRLPGR